MEDEKNGRRARFRSGISARKGGAVSGMAGAGIYLGGA